MTRTRLAIPPNENPDETRLYISGSQVPSTSRAKPKTQPASTDAPMRPRPAEIKKIATFSPQRCCQGTFVGGEGGTGDDGGGGAPPPQWPTVQPPPPPPPPPVSYRRPLGSDRTSGLLPTYA